MRDKRNISELQEWDRNPRTIDKQRFEDLKNQIKELGVYKPLLVDEEGTVLGGNMRLKALRELGHKEIWVSEVKAPTEELKIKYALSDNDQAGEYQKDDLANLIGNAPEIDLKGYHVQLGKSTDISDLLPKEVEEDEVPEVEEGEPDSKLGEVYELGRHRLMCGDATKIEDVEKLMNGQKADMVFTDPPYNVSIGTIKHPKFKQREIINDSMSDVDYQAFCDAVATTLKMFCWGCIYVCGAQHKDGRLLFTALDEVLQSSTTIIWKKDVFTLGRGKYQNQYEPIWFGWNESGKNFVNSRNLSNVWEVKRPFKSELHPTMKPIELCATAIKHASVENQTVLDIFGGSGSTLIACEQTNRTCYMMELDPKYCDVIRKRYENYKKEQ